MEPEPGYEVLVSVLEEALEQAQTGKGKERHAAGEPFEQQEICQTTRAVGFGYPLGQARKKAREAKRLFDENKADEAIAECLGAINYLAANIIVMREQIVQIYNGTYQARKKGCGARYINDKISTLL